MTQLLVRVVLYAIVMFLILVVYTGQQHDNARDILRESVRKTGKYLGWTVGLVVVMELCFWMFID